MHELTHCYDKAANPQLPIAVLNHLNSSRGGVFKLNTKFDTDSLLYSLSHFEGDDHTVHMLTQWSLPPPLTSTVKTSVFMHVHSSPPSLAARLHRCHNFLIMLTMAGLLPNRPHTYYMSNYIII